MCVSSGSCFGLSDTEYAITPSHTYIKPHTPNHFRTLLDELRDGSYFAAYEELMAIIETLTSPAPNKVRWWVYLEG